MVNTACPECQRVTQETHWRSDVVAQAGQAFGQGSEIYDYSPVGPDPVLRVNSSFFTGLPEVPSEGTWPAME